MKKTLSIIGLVVLVAVLMASCASGGGGSSSAPSQSGRTVGGNVPPFVRDALMNAPEDALIGIGSARMATQAQSRTIATTRARAEISRQMNTMIQDMIRDYTAGSEVDHSAVISFQENITVALSKAELTGSRVIGFDFTDDNTCWVVVSLGASNAVREINQAQAAAKLAVPAMASFNAEDRMNAAFDRAYNQPIQVNTTAQ